MISLITRCVFVRMREKLYLGTLSILRHKMRGHERKSKRERERERERTRVSVCETKKGEREKKKITVFLRFVPCSVPGVHSSLPPTSDSLDLFFFLPFSAA